MTIAPTASQAPPPGRHVGRAADLVAGLIGLVDRLPDGELGSAARSVEKLGRLVDALRVRVAGEIDARSPSSLPPEERVSHQYGCPNAAGLLALTTHAAQREIRARIRLDRHTRPATTLTGEPVPAAFADVGAALRAGELGVDAAHTITDALTKVRERGVADPADVAAAEHSLVALATGDVTDDEAPADTHDDVRAVTSLWATAIDPDGVDPDAGYAERTRGIRLGRERDGLVPVTGRLMPEVAGLLERLFDAHLASPNQTLTFTPTCEQAPTGTDAGTGTQGEGGNAETGGANVTSDATDGAVGDVSVDSAFGAGRDAADSDAVAGIDGASGASGGTDAAGVASAGEAVAPWSERDKPHDPRTVPQRQHDALMGMLTAAAVAPDAPTIGGAAPTLVVTTTVDDLAGGTCRADGVDIPMPARVAHRLACTSAIQKIVFDQRGKIIQLGSPARLFTSHQRRAIAARDGGCIIPGCHVPAAGCEIHHVTEHARGGATHTDNGVMLCWWHHHHIDDHGWLIRMRHGTPYVAAPAWIDPHRQYRPTRYRTPPQQRKRRRDRSQRAAVPPL